VGAEAGVVVPVRNLRAIAAAIARLALDDGLRRRMGAAAQARAAGLRNDAAALAAIETALAEAARPGPRPPLQALLAWAMTAWLGRL
jgi:glycosyltransferase involved in cell wall biosynthesis